MNSLPCSLSCFSFNPSIRGALGCNYHLSTGLILQTLLPEHGLLRTFVEGVAGWAFPLSIWRLEIRCVAINTTCPSCVAAANCLRCSKFFLYPHLYFLCDCQMDTRYFQKNNLNLAVDFLTALLLFIVRFVKITMKQNLIPHSDPSVTCSHNLNLILYSERSLYALPNIGIVRLSKN